MSLVLFLITKVTKYVLTFLTLFSRRPTMDPGCVLFMFRPFRLFYLPFVLSEMQGERVDHCVLIGFTILALFVKL